MKLAYGELIEKYLYYKVFPVSLFPVPYSDENQVLLTSVLIKTNNKQTNNKQKNIENLNLVVQFFQSPWS